MGTFENNVCKSILIADCLLSYDTNPNYVNKEGWAPIHIAARKGQKNAIKYIIM